MLAARLGKPGVTLPLAEDDYVIVARSPASRMSSDWAAMCWAACTQRGGHTYHRALARLAAITASAGIRWMSSRPCTSTRRYTWGTIAK